MTRAVFDRLAVWVRCHPLALAILLGLTLRLIAIESRSLHYDDAFSIFLSGRSLPEIVAGTAADTMPPLFYFLLHYWMLLNQQAWFIRLLSVIIGLSVIPIMFWTVESWLGRSAAGWAALLAAISPLQIYHSQDIRMYGLMMLGQMGYIWCFTRVWFAAQIGKPSRVEWVGMVVFGWIAMYSHNLAVFVLVVPDLFLLMQRRWRLLAQLAGAQFVMVLGALPWLVLIPGQIEKIQGAFWTPRPGLVEILQAIIMFHAALPLPSILLIISAVLSAQAFILVILETVRYGRRLLNVYFLAGLLLVPPVLLFIISYIMRPIFLPRAFLAASLAYYALAGFAIVQSWKRGAGRLIAAAFILLAVLTLPSYYRFQAFPRSPYPQAVEYLNRETNTDSVIVHETKLSYFPMHYYAPNLPQVFIADIPGSSNDTFAAASQQAMQLFPQPDLVTAVGSHKRIYFITFTGVFDEYKQMGNAEHPSIVWLSNNFHLTSRQVFNDLEIYSFEP